MGGLVVGGELAVTVAVTVAAVGAGPGSWKLALYMDRCLVGQVLGPWAFRRL
jgi:hypothetical protein